MSKKLVIAMIAMVIAMVFSLFVFSGQVFAASAWGNWNATGTGDPVWTCSVGCPISYTAGLPGTKQGLFNINMAAGYTKLTMSVMFKDPNGWVLNVGDSSTNNGYGGDRATFYNDAEMQIVNTNMSGYFNQFNFLDPYTNSCTPSCNPYPLPYPYPSFSMNRVLLPTGTTIAKFVIKDQFFNANFSATNVPFTLQNPYFLRLIGKDLEQPSGLNDKIWYAGVNRVIYGPGARIGKGALRIWFYLN